MTTQRRIRNAERKVSGIVIPFLIPRRSRGHAEVAARCSVTVHGMEDPLQIVSLLGSSGGGTLLKDTVSTLAQSIASAFKGIYVQLLVEFRYCIDRVSPKFEGVVYELPCYYVTTYRDRKINSWMGILYPVLVREGKVFVPGVIDFSLSGPPNIHFEDMVDIIQRSTGAVFYPGSSDKSVETGSSLDACKTSENYLRLLKTYCVEKDIASGGRAVVSYPDRYRLYDMEFTSRW